MSVSFEPRRADDEHALLARAAAFPECPTLASLTAEKLRALTDREGVDFATALLFDRIRRSPRHAAFIDRLDRVPAEQISPNKPPLTVAVVPAPFYREKPHTGADGRVIRETAASLGFRNELIPLSSTGTLRENSRTLLDWLARRHEEKIILVSLCKGGADVRSALAAPDAAARFANVVAWVNVCGTLNGSPVAEWLLATKPRFFAAWLFCKCRGHNFEFLRELRPSSTGPLSSPLQLPATMRFITLVGFPLRAHLTNAFMRRCHRFISPHGPNDGGVLLADLITLPGDLYPVWGADHYLRPEARAKRIFAAVLNYVSQGALPLNPVGDDVRRLILT
jgi:hypothetical protein